MASYNPTNGSSDHRFHILTADGAEKAGEHDPNEASQVAWLTAPEVRVAIERGEVPDGLSLTALLLTSCPASRPERPERPRGL